MLLDVASMALGKSLDRWGDGWGAGPRFDSLANFKFKQLSLIHI